MTGYVDHMITKRQSFGDFALSCARAFGALITMRDESMDAPVPEKFVPSDYHSTQLAADKAELARLNAMSPREQRRFGEAKRIDSIAQYHDAFQRAKQGNEPIMQMLDEVSAWIPPTPEHVELKDFMEKQLTTSLNDETYWLDCIRREEAKLPSEFFNEAIQRAEQSVTYHSREQEKEIERANSRTEWLQQLRDSLQKVTA